MARRALFDPSRIDVQSDLHERVTCTEDQKCRKKPGLVAGDQRQERSCPLQRKDQDHHPSDANPSDQRTGNLQRHQDRDRHAKKRKRQFQLCQAKVFLHDRDQRQPGADHHRLKEKERHDQKDAAIYQSSFHKPRP